MKHTNQRLAMLDDLEQQRKAKFEQELANLQRDHSSLSKSVSP